MVNPFKFAALLSKLGELDANKDNVPDGVEVLQLLGQLKDQLAAAHETEQKLEALVGSDIDAVKELFGVK